MNPMSEQKIEITTNEKGYKNINLKEKPLKGIKGIDDGNYIIVEKIFVEGKEFDNQYGSKSYSCKVKYSGEDVTFWLSNKEHDKYKTCGGEGDKVKIGLTEEKYINRKTGGKALRGVLSFELVV
jgi:hypothetical protein